MESESERFGPVEGEDTGCRNRNRNRQPLPSLGFAGCSTRFIHEFHFHGHGHGHAIRVATTIAPASSSSFRFVREKRTRLDRVKYKSSCVDRNRRSERFSPTQLNRPRVRLRSRNGPTFEIPLHPLGKMIAYNSLLIIPMNHWLSQFDRLNETAITFVVVFTWARNRYAYRGFIVEGIANFIQRNRRGERIRDIESKCELCKSYFSAECINSSGCQYTKKF